MPSLHVVDATYELFRSWFAVPERKDPQGREVGAVQGVLSTLAVLLRDPDVTHIGCATDHTVASFRNRLYEGYKTGEGLDPDLFAQFSILEDALRALGVTVWPMIEFEADDAVATATARYRDAFDRIVICSPDKDFAQLVEGERIVMLDRRREIVYDEEAVIAKFGVRPRSIPDWLALVGDAADGFPGIPAWGKKSAATVLMEYEAIEAIPGDPAVWTVPVRGAARLARSLAEHRDDAILFKTLATLRRDAPMDEAPEDLAWRGPGDAFEAFCENLGSPALAARFRTT